MNITRMSEHYFLATIDCKEAYYHIPIHKDYKMYFRFRFENNLYQFNCVCFGLCTAPRIFTKLSKPVFENLRSKGFKSVRYLDDFLLFSDSVPGCSNNVRVTVDLLERLGYAVQKSKSMLYPAQQIKYLGFCYD